MNLKCDICSMDITRIQYRLIKNMPKVFCIQFFNYMNEIPLNLFNGKYQLSTIILYRGNIISGHYNCI